jgi:hypothetical protein
MPQPTSTRPPALPGQKPAPAPPAVVTVKIAGLVGDHACGRIDAIRAAFEIMQNRLGTGFLGRNGRRQLEHNAAARQKRRAGAGDFRTVRLIPAATVVVP